MRSLVLFVSLAAANLLDAKFDSLAGHLLEALHVPGLSVAVVHKGVVESKGYGFSKLGPPIPATPDTLWFTGSTTKAFTAAAAAKILANSSAEEGLRWTTPMSHLLPGDFILSDDYASSHITLEDALSHRSGLASHDGSYGWGENVSATDIVRGMRHLPMSAEPRTRWQYNNPMFVAVGLFVEQFTERSLEEVLSEWFWKPLGMLSTTFSMSAASKLKDSSGNERLARGYFWTGEYYVPDAYIDLLPVAGAGATISSVKDYTLWAKAFLDAAKQVNNASSPIDNDMYLSLTTPRSIIPVSLGPSLHLIDVPTYALGWFIQKVGKHTVISHSGGLSGFGTELFLVPGLELAFITVGNTKQTSNEVGSFLFVEIIMSLGELSTSEEEAAKMSLNLMSGSQAKTKTWVKPVHPAPLQGHLDEYLGTYTHPGYGTFNVTLGAPKPVSHSDTAQQPFTQAPDPLILHVTPSTRTWPEMYVLTHSHHSFFDVGTIYVHGAPDLPACSTKLQCRNEIGYELLATSRAVFEIGLTGTVERLGIEAQLELARYAAEDGRDWREGMIWFDKE